MELLPGCKPLGYKWIFKRNVIADGSIDKYNERFVVKGYKHKKGEEQPEGFNVPDNKWKHIGLLNICMD